MVGLRQILANILGVILGLIFAFFLIGSLLFSDGGDLDERMFSFILVLSIYVIIGLGLAILDRRSRGYLHLSIPAIFISLVIFSSDGADDGTRIALYFIYPLLALFGSFIPFFLMKAILSLRKRSR